MNFRHVTPRDGLSQTSVLCMVEDDTGFLWMGTNDGLNRFDGRHFQVYRFDPKDPYSLSDNSVTCLLRDRDGAMWIGTNNGLNRYDPITEAFERFHKGDAPFGLPSDQIWSLLLDAAGRLWIGTDNGLCRLDAAPGGFITVPFATEAATPGGHAVLCLLEDRADALWAGTYDGGLFRLAPGEARLQPVVIDEETHPFGRGIPSMVQDRHGDLWIGSLDRGVTRYDPVSGRRTAYLHDPDDPYSLGHNDAAALLEDASGTLWVGTRGGGLNRFDPLRGGFVRHLHDEGRPAGLADDLVTSLYEDREGALWVGTYLGGADRYKQHMVTFDLLDLVPGGAPVQVWGVISTADGALWLGAQDGLFRYDPVSGARERMNGSHGLSAPTVWSLHQGLSGEIWLGTNQGLYGYRDETFTHYAHQGDRSHTLASEMILSVYQDGRGMVWACTNAEGLNLFDPETGVVRRFDGEVDAPSGFTSTKPRVVTEDRLGVVWVGTQGAGLFRYDGHGRFRAFDHDPEDVASLSHNHVLALHGDARDQNLLWVGTAGGLTRFDKKAEGGRSWRKADGLPNDYIYAVGQDVRGFLWLSTNRGLVVFDPEAERFRGFDVRDGLPSNEFNARSFAHAPSGRMYFGSLAGVVSFMPRDYAVDDASVPLAITDFYLSNRRVRPRALDAGSPLSAAVDKVDGVVLDHHQRMVGFGFAGLEFSAPWQCRYAYQMEGFDADWLYVDAGNTRATYTNLPAGSYVFRVKAANPDGYWSDDNPALHVTILAPLWLRPWAKGLYLILCLFLVAVYVRLQRGRLRRQRHIAVQERLLKEQAQHMAEQERATAARLEQQVQERTSAMITQEKMATLGMLSSGVAHELNNPNNFVYGGAQSLEQSLADVRAYLQRRRDEGSFESDELWELMEDMEEQLALIQRGAGRIRDVVDHMEQFVRKGEAYTRTDLVAGVSSTIVLVRSQYPEVLFEVVGEKELYCLVRPGEVNQVHLNLVLNACEAIARRRALDPAAPGRLVIEAERQGDRAVLRYEDTGDGFSVEQGRHLFEAFYTTKVGGSSTGLGLYTAWQIVHDHDGTLKAVSEPGLGSIFTLSLPLMKEKGI